MKLLRSLAVQVAAVCVGLVLSSLVLAIIGQSPPDALRTLLEGAFGSEFAFKQSLLKAIPLALAGLAVALPLRLNLWNIGAEGQLHAGAIGATWIALSFPSWPAGALLPLMIAAAMGAGGFWALLAAAPRAYLGVNEIITTLLLNFVAILTIAYLLTEHWRSEASLNFPVSDLFSPSAVLPTFGIDLINVGVFFPLAAALALLFVLARSKWGYEVRMIGASPAVARAVGMSTVKSIILAMIVAGAIAGVAGMAEVSTTFGRLRQGISPGYGYMGIVIAVLAGTNMIGVLVVALLFGGFVVGGLALQTEGVPQAFVLLVQGIILFCALAGARLTEGRPAFRLPARVRGRLLPKEKPSTP